MNGGRSLTTKGFSAPFRVDPRASPGAWSVRRRLWGAARGVVRLLRHWEPNVARVLCSCFAFWAHWAKGFLG
ncbi:hypothetical protein ES332_D04G087800v1 [Gossypium tomentosum]|uniref:Uncharacterized protein n=1 Tax=Gossypium tomentosum TaxID=34277 RepID=A0A5D2LBK2_GOSTO|nr:hypothetical protein ES332_D04G087800v1 [Gossypium tomentosum]